ncbi:MAG: STAS/SEC14 domain-containing protein [Polyangia bacterium]
MHSIFRDGDTVICRYEGATSIDELAAVHAILEEAMAEHPKVFQIIDMRSYPLPPPEVRRWIAEWAKTHTLGGVAFFGAHPLVRVATLMIQRTAQLFTQRPTTPLRFFATVEEARRWIDTLRVSPAIDRLRSGDLGTWQL